MMADFVVPVIASLVPSTIIGFGVAWLTTQKMMATYGVRIDRLEEILNAMETRERRDSERLTRVEAKIDILVENYIKPEQR